MNALTPFQALQNDSSLDEAVRAVTKTSEKPKTKEYIAFAEALAKDSNLTAIRAMDSAYGPETPEQTKILAKLVELDSKLLDKAPATAEKVYQCSMKLLGGLEEAEQAAKDVGVLSKYSIMNRLFYIVQSFMQFFGIADPHSIRQSIVLQYLALLPEKDRTTSAIKRGFQLSKLIDVHHHENYPAFLENCKTHIALLDAFIERGDIAPEQKEDILFCLAKVKLTGSDIEKVTKAMTPSIDLLQSQFSKYIRKALALLPAQDLDYPLFEKVATTFAAIGDPKYQNQFLQEVESIHENFRKEKIEKRAALYAPMNRQTK